MPEESTRNWSITYTAVIAVEIATLLALWWLQNAFLV